MCSYVEIYTIFSGYVGRQARQPETRKLTFQAPKPPTIKCEMVKTGERSLVMIPQFGRRGRAKAVFLFRARRVLVANRSGILLSARCKSSEKRLKGKAVSE